MKTKLLLFSAMAFVMLCFNGCTPDEVETVQDQFKPLVIRATIGEPIQPLAGVNPNNSLSLQCNLGVSTLSSSVPNNVGQSVIEFSGTAVSNTNIICYLTYLDYAYNSAMTSVLTDCDPVTLEIIYDGVIVYEEIRNVGGVGGATTPCGDGSGWTMNYTLP
jgi:hypothetical protein